MPQWTVATWIPRLVFGFVLAVALDAVTGVLERNRVAWAATITVTSTVDPVMPGDITVALTSIPTSIVTVTPVFDTAQVGVAPNPIHLSAGCDGAQSPERRRERRGRRVARR